ncbi:hypothetical protein CA265_21145 [Sphingobacteriaceae bacterium GW460-11-11-14-LB5]|nr:hypothetical protein CA265_21145 [Sphingobacteriaceae bacterium GW460-11-11-14-LB5]
MKYLFILLLLCAVGAKAQNGLKFNKLLIDCENKWIAISLDDGAPYTFGYVYLDNSAGLSFKQKGTFTIENDVYLPIHTAEVKSRIEPTEMKVSLIPAKRLAELKVEESPGELEYIGKNNSRDRYGKLAQTYKKWKRYKLADKFENLASGTYTHFYFDGGDFVTETVSSPQKTRKIKAFNGNYTDSYKQEIFWLTQAKKMREAQLTYIDAIRNCDDETAKADMAYNIAYQYYIIADVKKFNIWSNEVKRWIVKDNNYLGKIEKMQAMLKK